MGRKYRGANRVEDTQGQGQEAGPEDKPIGVLHLYPDGVYEWEINPNAMPAHEVIGLLEMIKADVIDSTYFVIDSDYDDCEETEDDYE